MTLPASTVELDRLCCVHEISWFPLTSHCQWTHSRLCTVGFGSAGSGPRAAHAARQAAAGHASNRHGHASNCLLQQGQQATGGTAAMAMTSAGGIRGMERALFAVLTRRTARARAAIRTWWLTANLGPLMCSPCPGLPRWPAYRCPLGHWPPLWHGMGVQGPLMWQW